MKNNLLLILLALGLVAFLPQRAKADGYFGISVGPSYCDPYPVYYGGYYPHRYRQYYYRRTIGCSVAFSRREVLPNFAEVVG